MRGDLVAIARRFLGVTESLGANRGYWVQRWQRVAGLQPGDPYCCAFICDCLDVAYLGHSPFILTGSCEALLANLRTKGCVFSDLAAVQPGDLYFLLDATGLAHHVGVATRRGAPLHGIAGNTSPDGKSREGTGVFEHEIDVPPARLLFGRLP